jgi:hypothetical protein
MTIPILLADASLHFGEYVTQAAQQWMLTGANLFWSEGKDIMQAMIKPVIAILAGIIFIDILRGGTGEGAFGTVVYRMGRFAIALWLIKYYNQPFYGGLAFHQLMPEAARQLAVYADDKAVAKAQDEMDDLEEQMTAETIFDDIGELITLWVIKAIIALYGGFMLFLSASGYVLIAIAVTVGPLSIPFLVFDKTAFLFWDWLGFWIAASMYQVIAAVMTNIFANIQLLALPSFDGLDGLEIAGAEAALILALLLSALTIGGICAALYGKGAAAAANVASSITAGALSIIRMV